MYIQNIHITIIIKTGRIYLFNTCLEYSDIFGKKTINYDKLFLIKITNNLMVINYDNNKKLYLYLAMISKKEFKDDFIHLLNVLEVKKSLFK